MTQEPPTDPRFPPLFTVSTAPQPATIRLTGEMDLFAAGRLGPAVDALGLAGTAPIVVDLTDLTFCDMSGLRELVALHAWLTKRHGAVSIRGARPHIQRLFVLNGLQMVLALDPPRPPYN